MIQIGKSLRTIPLVLLVLEILLFMWLGHMIGYGKTLLLAFLTSIVGVIVLKQQGLGNIGQMQQRFAMNMMLGQGLDGLFIGLGGILLIMPGFITDILGVCCLVPQVRSRLFSFIWKKLMGGMSFPFPMADAKNDAFMNDFVSSQRETRGQTIDGVFTRDDAGADNEK